MENVLKVIVFDLAMLEEKLEMLEDDHKSKRDIQTGQTK